MICLSFVRLSNPKRSTTVNHSPCPTSCSALITHASAPCVTAYEILLNLSPGLRCPVLSSNLYTATTILPRSGLGTASKSLTMLDSIVLGSSGVCTGCIVAQPVNKRKAATMVPILNIKTQSLLQVFQTHWLNLRCYHIFQHR